MFALLIPTLQECMCEGSSVPCECCLANPYMPHEEIMKNRALLKQANNNMKKYEKLQRKAHSEPITLKQAMKVHVKLARKKLSKFFH